MGQLEKEILKKNYKIAACYSKEEHYLIEDGEETDECISESDLDFSCYTLWKENKYGYDDYIGEYGTIEGAKRAIEELVEQEIKEGKK